VLRNQLYWSLTLRILSQIATFVISIFVARLLDPSDFGVMGIAMMLIGYANVFTDFGFSQAIIQKNIFENKIINSIFTFNFVISGIFFIIFYILSDFIALYFDNEECSHVIKTMSFAFVVTSFYVVPSAMLRRDLKFKLFSILELFKNLFMSFTTLILAYLGYGYWALAYGQLLPMIIFAFIFCLNTRWLPAFKYNHSLMGDVYSFGVWNFLRTQLEFASRHVDKFYVGKYLGVTSLGYYDKSVSLSNMPIESIFMNINSVMFSSYSHLKNDKTEIKKHFKKSICISAILGYPIYIGLFLVSPYFVYSMLGEKWAPMIPAFQVLILAFVFKIFLGNISSLNIAIGKYKEQTTVFFISFICFLLFIYLFAYYGLAGVSLSCLFFNFIYLILGICIANKYLQIPFFEILSPFSGGLIPSILMFFVVELFSSYIFVDYTAINLFLLSIIGFIVYIILFLLDFTNKIAVEIKSQIFHDILGALLKNRK